MFFNFIIFFQNKTLVVLTELIGLLIYVIGKLQQQNLCTHI